MNPAIIGARIDIILPQQVFIPPQSRVDIFFDISPLMSPRRSWSGENALYLSLRACRTGLAFIALHFSSGADDA